MQPDSVKEFCLNFSVLEKTCKKEDLYWDIATGAHRLIGARPVEHDLTKTHMSFQNMGKGGLLQLGLPIPFGVRGGLIHIHH